MLIRMFDQLFRQDEEIKSYVKEILDQANLEEITMKVVCKQVYAKFPQFDLSHKKDFIKTTVKSVRMHMFLAKCLGLIYNLLISVFISTCS